MASFNAHPPIAGPPEREAPDDLVFLLRLPHVLEASFLENAVRGVALRQRMGDHLRAPVIGECLREHRPGRRGRETAPPAGFGDLDSAVFGGPLKPPQPTSSGGSTATKK